MGNRGRVGGGGGLKTGLLQKTMRPGTSEPNSFFTILSKWVLLDSLPVNVVRNPMTFV